jgi:hypothetical protein
MYHCIDILILSTYQYKINLSLSHDTVMPIYENNKSVGGSRDLRTIGTQCLHQYI